MSAQLKLLSKDQIIAVSDVIFETVEVSEWGGSVRVRGLTGTERDAFEDSVLQGKGKNRDINLTNFRAKLVARSMVDEEGNRLFSDQEAGLLGKKSAAALQRVFDVAKRLSGMSDEDVEELTKNSESDQSDGSTSV